MKAILVVDMPNNCEECKIIYLQGRGESSICDSGDWSKRPSWCPLKPLPDSVTEEETGAYVKGFMDALVSEVDDESSINN